MRALAICLHLVRLEIKSRMEYRGAFIIHAVAMFLNYASAFTAIWILLEKFGTLGGWTWPEIALLLSFQLLAYALGAATSCQAAPDISVKLALLTSAAIWPPHP